MELKPQPSSKTSVAFFTTGSVRIKTEMFTQPATRSVLLRRIRMFTCRAWTDPLPIGAFLINHPSGPFLFDTGESPCCNDAGYLPSWNFVPRLLTNTAIKPEDSIVHQLKKHGVDPKSLKGVILSHLHGDHAGGLEELVKEAPDVPIYVGKEHWEAFGLNPFTASINGCVPQHWPKDFAPRLLEAKDHPIGPWKVSYPLTEDGRVAVVDTPGHVPGHVSLVVRGENDDGSETTYFLPGDATYAISLLENEETDGVNDDPLRALESVKMIKEFARREEVVVLPSHDADTPRLLKDKIVYKVDSGKHVTED